MLFSFRSPRLIFALALSSFSAVSLALDLGKVMPIGDSITLGAGSVDGYRMALHNDLAPLGITWTYTGQNTANSAGMADPGHEGHSGWSIEDVTSGRADETSQGTAAGWIARDRPDAILLMLGTNNALQQISSVQAKFTQLFSSIFSIEPDVRVYWSSIPKSYAPHTGRASWERDFDAMVRSMATDLRAAGRNVTYVDSYSAFDYATDLSDDYHPNATGYAKIANSFAGAIVQSVPEPMPLAGLGLGAFALGRRRR